MGLFGRKQQEKPQTRTNRAATDEWVTLRDPGLPDGHLRQRVHGLFNASGLTYVVYGNGTADECLQALAEVAPAANQSSVIPAGFGLFGSQESMPMVALDGPAGSAIAVFSMPDIDVMLLSRILSDRLPSLPENWSWTMAMKDAQIASSAAKVIDSAAVVPLWNLQALAHTRPEEEPSAIVPTLLRDRLIDSGWEQFQEKSLFKTLVPTFGDRTQFVYFGAMGPSHLALWSIVANVTEDGSLPEMLRGKSFEPYNIDIMGDCVVLQVFFPAGPPSPLLEEISQRAVELASYCDRIEADLSAADQY